MSNQIVLEGRQLLYCFLSGVILTVVYDIFRIIRRVIKHNIFWISVEDIVFWIAVSIFWFCLFYITNSGIIRWFSIAGAAVGMLVYKYTIGEHIVEFMSTFIKKIQHMVCRVISWMLKPIKSLIKRMFGKAKQILRKIKKVTKKKLTGNIKKFKITLCKRKDE